MTDILLPDQTDVTMMSGGPYHYNFLHEKPSHVEEITSGDGSISYDEYGVRLDPGGTEGDSAQLLFLDSVWDRQSTRYTWYLSLNRLDQLADIYNVGWRADEPSGSRSFVLKVRDAELWVDGSLEHEFNYDPDGEVGIAIYVDQISNGDYKISVQGDSVGTLEQATGTNDRFQNGFRLYAESEGVSDVDDNGTCPGLKINSGVNL